MNLSIWESQKGQVLKPNEHQDKRDFPGALNFSQQRSVEGIEGTKGQLSNLLHRIYNNINNPLPPTLLFSSATTPPPPPTRPQKKKKKKSHRHRKRWVFFPLINHKGRRRGIGVYLNTSIEKDSHSLSILREQRTPPSVYEVVAKLLSQ